MLKRALFLNLILGLAVAPPADAKSIIKELKAVAKTLQAAISDKPGLKLAVLSFPYTDGKASEGPVVVQERLTTLFIQNKKITVIERNLLKKAMGELSLQVSGVIDETTVKKLGKMLGASAVVYGTLHDLSDKETELNARIMEVETGITFAGASASEIIKKTWKDAAVAGLPPVTGQNRDFGGGSIVQLAVLLDTSNSMDGLINQARNQLWKIINELISSEKSGSRPAIEVAVYEYGNSALARESGYLRQVLPFTSNLDKVSEELFALKTNGGDEYCGQVIKEAVTGLDWSKKGDVYKAVFIAGNEPFTQGPVDFRSALALAKSKGIFVNTIFCGSRQEGIATQWLAGAQGADGDYTNIDQSLVVEISAPQDDQLAQLSSKLNETYVPYGADGRSELRRQTSLENKIAAGGAGVMAERAAFKAQAPAAQTAHESSWDAVTAIESGKMKSEELEKDQLPEELKKMDKAELQKYINSKLVERKKIKADITRLQSERRTYLAVQGKNQAGPATLDKAVIDSVRRQAAQKGYKFK
ncbi:MAG: VWA domain-containing protein [Elusimicrobia bacterium]|nr:VWA domain-containing protein [Elusimicrobiota bacterium]